MPFLPKNTSPIRAKLLKEQGDEIRRARIESRLTQKSASMDLNVTSDTLRSWEKGIRSCPIRLRKIVVRKWGGDPGILKIEADTCPSCGKRW